jgi:predicted ATP-grasp superfamily ATP-dependent carboligase
MGETKSRLWLGCRSDAIRITTSKIATARILADAGIPSIPTPDKCGDIPSSLTGWVAKPDDGAGACDMIATFDHDHLQGWLKSRRHSHVVQPRIEGVHASATFLARDGQASLLCLNSQILEMSDTECQYRGGIVGCFEEHREQVTKIVESVVQTIPGLWGPVGLDLILTEAGPVVVEINPRLTTLWSGLGQSMGLNPAQLVLDLAEGRPLPVCRPLNEVQVIV